MFPDYDADVLSSVLATQGGNLEATIQMLLDMGDPNAPPPGPSTMGGGGIDSDEELAMALFRQFAEDLTSQLGVKIPEEVQNDPERYEAFVREHFERELARPDSALTARATEAVQQRGNSSYQAQYESRGGQKGLLERFRGIKLGGGGGRAKMVSVGGGQGTQSLLAAEHGGEPQERV
tara:strand:+ start:416 stop:949 length:534 start_codon:yes stop_codon:yes gene_type:complete